MIIRSFRVVFLERLGIHFPVLAVGSVLRDVLKLTSMALIGLCYSGMAYAHGGYDPRLKLAVSESELRLEISIAAEYVLEFDENRDGDIQVSEFKKAYEDIAIWVENRLSLMDHDNTRLLPFFSDAAIVDGDHFEKGDAISHIKIRRRYTIKAAEQSLRLSTELYHKFPVLVYSRAGQFEHFKPLKVCLKTDKKTACQSL